MEECRIDRHRTCVDGRRRSGLSSGMRVYVCESTSHAASVEVTLYTRPGGDQHWDNSQIVISSREAAEEERQSFRPQVGSAVEIA